MTLIDYMLSRENEINPWDFPRLLDAISSLLPSQVALKALYRLKEIAQRRIRKWEEREAFIRKAEQLEYEKLNPVED